jgi:hypothetical protein
MVLGSSAVYSPSGDISTFEGHRDEAEQMASDKYDGGGYHDYANSRVVVLAASDWTRAPAQQQRRSRLLDSQTAAP